MQPGKKFANRFWLPVFMLIPLLVAACGGGGTSQTTSGSTHTKAPDNKQILVLSAQISAVSDINSFDPAIATDFNSATAIYDVFTGLVSLDDKGNVQPQLAQSWDKSSDGLTYTFHLKPNLKFSDGTPLTSHDIAYSLDRAFQPATKSPTASYYMKYIKDQDKLSAGKIKTIIGDSLLTPDDNTLQIVISKPIAFFLDTLTFQCSLVVEKKLIDKYGAQWTEHLDEGGGAGPFQVKKWVHNKEIDFIPNPNYYGAKPQIKELVYPFYKVQDTTRKDYLINRLDDGVVPLADLATDRHRSDFISGPILATNYYTMNYNQKPFDNVHIRQAFALAVDKDLIVNKIWKGSFIATNHIIPKGMPGYNPDLTGPDGTTSTKGDPAKAKQLFQQGLQEEGYSSAAQLPSITLTYSSGGNQAAKDEVAALQQMWQSALGATVKTNDIDLNTIFNDQAEGANNPLQFYSGPAWISDYPDGQDWTTLQFDKGASQNSMNYGQNKGANAAEQQQVQQEMEQADLMQDPAARLKAIYKIEQELVNDVAWFPIEQQVTLTLRKPCVQGIVDNAQNIIPPDDWAKIYVSTDSPCANATVGSL